MRKVLQRFIDINCEENLIDGLPYYAAGLVLEDDQCGASDKRFLVEFIDPFGRYQTEWRSSNEITVREISERDFLHIKECYSKIERLSD